MIIQGFTCGGHTSPRKVWDENKRNKENDARVKSFLMEGRSLYWCYTKLVMHLDEL